MAGQLFEMKIDTAKMKKMAKALEINSQVMPELKTNNPPLGCFTADIGPMNQYIQFYMYSKHHKDLGLSMYTYVLNTAFDLQMNSLQCYLYQ